MAAGPAYLLIPFKSHEHMLNYVGSLREDPPTQTQPFGGDVNAVVYERDGDDTEVGPENWAILVPGYRTEEFGDQLLLPPPGEAAEKPAPRPSLRRPRGVPDQPFAPHGTAGGEVPPSSGRKSGLDEPAPY